MKTALLCTALLLAAPMVSAQQTIGQMSAGPIRTTVNTDNSVTFRLQADSSAKVAVTGDFLPEQTPFQILEPDQAGVWTYTTEPLEAELYNYRFIVDGVPTLDPSNLSESRDIVTRSNRLLIIDSITTKYDFHADIPHGGVSRLWYHDNVSDKDRRVSVYTPAGYGQTDQRYPVLYLLHGMGGDEEAWLDNGRVPQILDYMIANGEIDPLIVVMTNGNPKMAQTPTEWVIGTPAPDWQDYSYLDGSFESSIPGLVDWVDRNYQTSRDRYDRMIAGLSMGGFHSMMISKEYPELFGYVGLMSAATGKDLGMAGIEMYDNFDQKLQFQFDNAPLLYWIGIGKDDFLYKSNQAYREKLDKLGANYKYYESDGGHTWRNWRRYLQIFLKEAKAASANRTIRF